MSMILILKDLYIYNEVTTVKFSTFYPNKKDKKIVNHSFQMCSHSWRCCEVIENINDILYGNSALLKLQNCTCLLKTSAKFSQREDIKHYSKTILCEAQWYKVKYTRFLKEKRSIRSFSSLI